MIRKRATRGFTLIEMVIVVAIVGILASAAFPVASLVAQRSKEAELRSALRQVREALDAYKRAGDEGRIERSVDASGYPSSLDVLASGVTDIKRPDGQKIYFLRRVPRDPMNDDARLAAAETWALRSYASPPESPEEGKDVFDIHSRSARTGLNGVPYREW
ncbi:type II secretion system protein [Viridibacterium curvum]|uniref:Type II secretion system protein n=1 Tax=Viridibacterium curvum TaxID=1101404 RepID=A0ABP9QKW5_9RHOO